MKIEITTAVKERKKLEECRSPDRKAFEGILVVRIYSTPIPEPRTPESKFIHGFCSQLLTRSYVSTQYSNGFQLQVSLRASEPGIAGILVEAEKAWVYTLIGKNLSLHYEKKELWDQTVTITV